MASVTDFGPGSPGCIDCMDGHCTMNCSSRGRADLPTRREEARTVLHMPAPPEPMKAIADLLRSSLPEIPITFSTPTGDDRPHPIYELTRDANLIFPDPDRPGELIPGPWVARVGNFYQAGGSLDTGDLAPDESECWIKREQIGDLAGLKIFAEPRVPPGEIWMGVDLGSKPDISARFYRDANGNYIISKGDPE